MNETDSVLDYREERGTIGCTTSRRVVVFEVEDRSRRPRDPYRSPNKDIACQLIRRWNPGTR